MIEIHSKINLCSVDVVESGFFSILYHRTKICFVFQTVWTNGLISVIGDNFYRFGGIGGIVANDGVPLSVQNGRPLVTFSRKKFLYKRVQLRRSFFALCEAKPIPE